MEQPPAEVSEGFIIGILPGTCKSMRRHMAQAQVIRFAHLWEWAKTQSKREHPCELAGCGYGRSQLKGRQGDIRAGRLQQKQLFCHSRV